MPQSLAKVTKKIIRKKGRATGLHERSRDAAKLRKASAREERVHRQKASKARAEEGYVHRIAFFQAALHELEAGRGVGETAALTKNQNGAQTSRDDAQSEDATATDASSNAADPQFSTATLQSVIATFIDSLASLHPTNKSYSSNRDLPFKGFRPAARTAAEEKVLERQKAARREYLTGFWCPDLRDQKVREELRDWAGNWAGLRLMAFVRVDIEGNVNASAFPPRGGE